jgi:hypothetical protein
MGNLTKSTFTIYFENPFWVGVLEESFDGVLFIGRHVFGAEPTNAELVAFYLNDFASVPRLRVEAASSERNHPANFKRSVREARRDQGRVGVRPSSHDAYRKAFEEEMKSRASDRRTRERLDEEERYLKRVEMKKEARKGH